MVRERFFLLGVSLLHSLNPHNFRTGTGRKTISIRVCVDRWALEFKNRTVREATIVFTSQMVTTRRQISALAYLEKTRARDVVLGNTTTSQQQQQLTSTFETWASKSISVDFANQFNKKYVHSSSS